MGMKEMSEIEQDLIFENAELENVLEAYSKTIDMLRSEKAELIAILNKIALLGSGSEAYTSDFTNKVNDIVRGTLVKYGK